MTTMKVKGNIIQYGVTEQTKEEFIEMIERNIKKLKDFIRRDKKELKELEDLKLKYENMWTVKGLTK